MEPDDNPPFEPCVTVNLCRTGEEIFLRYRVQLTPEIAESESKFIPTLPEAIAHATKLFKKLGDA